MRLKRLFLGIMLSAGIANIGAANYTPENVSVSLKVPGNDAKHPAAGLPGPVQIAVLGQRLDIERRLDDIDLEFAEFRHAAAGDGLELILKDAAVLSLQDDLAQFQ